MTVTIQYIAGFNPPTLTIPRVCVIKEEGTNFVFETYHGALPGTDAYIAMEQVYGPNFSFASEESRETYAREVPIASVVSMTVLP